LAGTETGMVGAKSRRDIGNFHPHNSLRNNLRHKPRISSRISKSAR
jgi:hypothetical protein